MGQSLLTSDVVKTTFPSLLIRWDLVKYGYKTGSGQWDEVRRLVQYPVCALTGRVYALLSPFPVLIGWNADVMVGGGLATWKPSAGKGSQEEPGPPPQ